MRLLFQNPSILPVLPMVLKNRLCTALRTQTLHNSFDECEQVMHLHDIVLSCNQFDRRPECLRAIIANYWCFVVGLNWSALGPDVVSLVGLLLEFLCYAVCITGTVCAGGS